MCLPRRSAFCVLVQRELAMWHTGPSLFTTFIHALRNPPGARYTWRLPSVPRSNRCFRVTGRTRLHCNRWAPG